MKKKRKASVRVGKHLFKRTQHRSASVWFLLTNFFISLIFLVVLVSRPLTLPCFHCTCVCVCVSKSHGVLSGCQARSCHTLTEPAQSALSHVKSPLDLTGHQTEPSMGSLATLLFPYRDRSPCYITSTIHSKMETFRLSIQADNSHLITWIRGRFFNAMTAIGYEQRHCCSPWGLTYSQQLRNMTDAFKKHR